MSRFMPPQEAARKRIELARSAAIFDETIGAANRISRTISFDRTLVDAEKELWCYSSEVLAGLSDYLGARGDRSGGRVARGEAATAKINGAIEHMRKIDPNIKGTWGAYDLEWMREIWLNALRGGLEGEEKSAEELL